MPDRKTEIIDIFESKAGKVCVFMRVTGTNTGGFPLLGVPANRKKVDIQWVSIYTVKRGKVVSHTAINDVMTLMIQLGAIPAPA